MTKAKAKWTILFTKEAKKGMSRLDKSIQKRIHRFMEERVAFQEDPRLIAEPLGHNLKGLWRYRIANNYRVLCEIRDDRLLILVVDAGHRSKVYVVKH